MPRGEKIKLLWQNPEYRKHMSEVHKGHIMSEKTKEKIRKALKGRTFSKESIQKRIKSRKGYKHSEETKRKLSKAIKKAYTDGKKFGFQKGNKFGSEEGYFKKGHKINLGRKRLDMLGENHFNWKGGRIKTNRGYIFIRKPEHPFCEKKGYIAEHRLVVEKQIGRYLLPTEKCHHLGKRDDNRPHMLMAFSNHSAHRRFETNGKYKKSEIIFDGRKLQRKRKETLKK